MTVVLKKITEFWLSEAKQYVSINTIGQSVGNCTPIVGIYIIPI